MLFNSYIFFVFAALFFSLWRFTSLNRIALINVGGICFYGAWNPWFLIWLIGSAFVDYHFSNLMERDRSRARLYLLVSLVFNFSVLGFFKYFNFIALSAADLAALTGHPFSSPWLDIILPIGISFYTFQSVSYIIDVYRREVPVCHSFADYFAFIGFFPQLIAGPIERASHLLVQLTNAAQLHATPQQLRFALVLILGGAIKKLVIADNLAPYIDLVFGNIELYRWQTIALATLFFSVQIYCDFSGYTDIARGLAGLLGIDLMKNFNAPYSAASIRDFWRRWHISLSTWLRDYLYRSLGGNRQGLSRTYRNILITMLLGGLWHGAAYNFILWGLYHGVLLVLHRLWDAARPTALVLPSAVGWALTMFCVGFGWFLFRMHGLEDLFLLTGKLLGENTGMQAFPEARDSFALLVFLAVFAIEFFYARGRFDFFTFSRPLRYALLSLMFLVLYTYAAPADRSFIYFQF